MKNIRQTALIAIAATLLSGCGVGPEARYERAVESFAEHDLASARLDLISALQEKPGDPAMLLLLARTQIGLGDGEGATSTLETLAGLQEPDEETRALLATANVLRGRADEALAIIDGDKGIEAERARALAHIAKGDYAEAEAALDRGLELDGSKAELQATAARFAMGQGNFERARTLVAAALKDNPELLDALLASGQIETADGKLPAALKAYDAALALHPANVQAMIGRLGVLGDMGRLQEAKTQLADVSEQVPNRPDVLYLRARFAGENGDWEEARSILQPHEDAIRSSAALQVLYAQTLLEMGQVEQARSWIAPVVRRYPGQRLARRVMGEAQLRSGDAKAALASLAMIAERPDAGANELRLAAQAAERAGDPRANAFASRASRPAPEWIATEIAKADAAMREGRWGDAAASYGRIKQRSSRPNAIVLNNYAYAEGQLGNNDKAVGLALEAVKLAPENPSILDTAGWLLASTGQDKQRGITMLEKAAKLDPGNATIADHLARAKS
ncbi:tetratricopeptide repeat protein [Qipengyuania sp. DSG2-2]|uniref:tetratricopeptide repeat protein n=1 Tax=Qipengyuania sp. DGS2-2 TaxID=3349631 RepID=UPI0036D3CBDE